MKITWNPADSAACDSRSALHNIRTGKSDSQRSSLSGNGVQDMRKTSLPRRSAWRDVLASIVCLAMSSPLAFGMASLLLDAPPNDAARRYLAITRVDEPSTQGFAALGFFAHPEDDPVAVGRQRYEAVRRYLVEHERQREAPAIIDYPFVRRIESPRQDCELFDKPCLAATEPESSSYATLPEGFDRWMNVGDVRMPIDPERIGWSSSMAPLLGAQRLRLALLAGLEPNIAPQMSVKALASDLKVCVRNWSTQIRC